MASASALDHGPKTAVDRSVAGGVRLLMLSISLLGAPGAVALAPWWDAAWQLRIPLRVEVGTQTFGSGYAGYTVTARIPIADLLEQELLREDCADLRLIRRAPPADEAVPFLLHRCDAETATLSFMLHADLAPGTADTSHWLYAGNPEAEAETLTAANAVYAYDLASDPDPLGSLTIAAPRAPLVVPEEPQLTPEDGALGFSLGDGEGLRLILPTQSRGLEVILQMDHHNCFPLNMHSGIGVGGDTDPEAGIWYLRGWNRACGGGYSDDAALRAGSALFEPSDTLGPVPTQDHRMQLRIVEEDPIRVHVVDGGSTPHRMAVESDGVLAIGAIASVQIGQEGGRITTLRARRYTEPEPVVTAGTATRGLLLQRSSCDAALPHELALNAPVMAWISDRITVNLDLDVAATLEDPRSARQLLRVSAAGSGGILRLDLEPGRLPVLHLATQNGVVRVAGDTPLRTGARQHIVLRYDGETLQVWIDDELAGSAPADGMIRRGDGPFEGLEGLSPRVAIRSLAVYGEAINREELATDPSVQACEAVSTPP
jgi:hypothetical protein